MATNIQSSKIKVYPSSRRDDAKDRNAKLNSEQNLISSINRLTSKTSFVIDGLGISSEVTGSTKIQYLDAGSCNIYGYYFKLLDRIQLKNNMFTSLAKNDILYFKIRLKKTVTSNIEFVELINADNDGSSLTLLDDSNSNFIGLLLMNSSRDFSTTNYVDNDPQNSYTDYYLPLATYTGSEWIQITANDGWTASTEDNRHRWNTLKIKASDIQVDGLKGGLETGPYYSNTQDLATFLRTNYVIDDGIIQ